MESNNFDFLIPLGDMDKYPCLKDQDKKKHENKNGQRKYYIKYSMTNEEGNIKMAINELFCDVLDMYDYGELTQKEIKTINEYYQWWYSDSLL